MAKIDPPILITLTDRSALVVWITNAGETLIQYVSAATDESRVFHASRVDDMFREKFEKDRSVRAPEVAKGPKNHEFRCASIWQGHRCTRSYGHTLNHAEMDGEELKAEWTHEQSEGVGA